MTKRSGIQDKSTDSGNERSGSFEQTSQSMGRVMGPLGKTATLESLFLAIDSLTAS